MIPEIKIIEENFDFNDTEESCSHMIFTNDQSKLNRSNSFLSIGSSCFNADLEDNCSFYSECTSYNSINNSTLSLSPSQADLGCYSDCEEQKKKKTTTNSVKSNKLLIEQDFRRRQGVVVENVISKRRRRRAISENNGNNSPDWVEKARKLRSESRASSYQDVRIIY